MQEKMRILYNRKEYSKLNQDVDEVNQLASNIASQGALVLAICAFITLCVIAPFSMLHVVSAITVINVIFHNYFAIKFFGEKNLKWIRVYCVCFLMLTMPIQWFYTGGFHGVGGLWMLFSSVYCIFTIQGTLQLKLLNIMGVEYVIILIVNILHPEYATTLDAVKENTIGFVSIFGIGAYIQITQLLQHIEFLKDRKTLGIVQKELAQHYQESIETNDELVDAASRLEMANKMQRSFMASVNHELRSPLNGIEGCLQILMMDKALSAESKETVKNALTASKSINQTINDLLDYAKLEEGQFEIIKKPFDLRDILDNISIMFKPLANAKNLKFIIQIPMESRVSIYGDGTRIQQIMANLISNGIKYTREGTVTMTIVTKRGHLMFDVTDTGQGMSAESLAVLFEPFTRFNVSENVHIQGTGLGMNIVSNIVSAMNGTISAESELEVGTTFHVDIPILFYDSDVIYSSLREEYSLQDANVDLSYYKVLCVDDTEINRTVFKGILKQSGAYVVTAENGAKAIQICEEQGFDIIFMDHIMPGIDGIETMKRIRAIEGGRFEQTPIIMFTGNESDEYQQLYLEQGANGYLNKPVIYRELVECFNLLS